MGEFELYTVVPQEEGAVAATVDRYGSGAKYPTTKVSLKPMPYTEAEYAALTAFTAEYYYMVDDTETEYVGVDDCPMKRFLHSEKVPVPPADVVVCNGKVYGLLRISPFRETVQAYQVITVEHFNTFYFSFSDVFQGDSDHDVEKEYRIMKKDGTPNHSPRYL